MSIYFVPEFLLFVLALFSYKLPRKTIILWFGIICVLWFIVFSLRRQDVGNDTLDYVNFFLNGRGKYGSIDDPNDSEYGFVFISRCIKAFTSSYTVYFTIIAGWLWIMIFKIYVSIADFRKIFAGLLVLFVIGDAFVPLMVALRQCVAICVFLTGLYVVLKLKTKDGFLNKRAAKREMAIGVLIMCAAGVVHKSMIILIPILAIVFFLRIGRRALIVMVIVSTVIAYLYSDTIGTLFNLFFIYMGGMGIDFIKEDVMNVYSEDFGGNSQKLLTYMAWALPAILTIYLSKKEQVKSFFFKCYILSVCIFLVFSTSFLISRINIVLMLLGFTQFLPDVAVSKFQWRTIYMFFILAMLYKAFMRFNNWPDTDSCIPYHFFWE